VRWVVEALPMICRKDPPVVKVVFVILIRKRRPGQVDAVSNRHGLTLTVALDVKEVPTILAIIFRYLHDHPVRLMLIHRQRRVAVVLQRLSHRSPDKLLEGRDSPKHVSLILRDELHLHLVLGDLVRVSACRHQPVDCRLARNPRSTRGLVRKEEGTVNTELFEEVTTGDFKYSWILF
tara:strand:- start:508 stop:1041 length:534 start_codon:yes stop_codon:yes gene_type:complete